MPINEEFLREIGKFLKNSQIILDHDNLTHYSYDATERHSQPVAAFLPENTGEVSRIIQCASRYAVPVTPQGGRTGLSGGALPVAGGIVLSFIRMNRILEIDEANMFAVVEPGVISNDLQIAVERTGPFLSA